MLGLPGDAVPFQVHVKLRPHVEQFLESLSKTYEVPRAPRVPLGSCGKPVGCLCIGEGGTRAACVGTFACSSRSSSSQLQSGTMPRRSWMCWTPRRS